MKKFLTIALLAMVSWALACAPAQAAEVSHHHQHTLAKHHKKHHQHKHKKHRKA